MTSLLVLLSVCTDEPKDDDNDRPGDPLLGSRSGPVECSTWPPLTRGIELFMAIRLITCVREGTQIGEGYSLLGFPVGPQGRAATADPDP